MAPHGQVAAPLVTITVLLLGALALAVLIWALLSQNSTEVSLRSQVQGLHSQVYSLILQRDLRHVDFCRYLHAEAVLGRAHPALEPLSALATSEAVREGCFR